MIRRAVGAALAGALLAGTGLVASPAAAAVAGELVFQCDALMDFPGGGGANCNGIVGEVAATGTDDAGRSFTVAGVGQVNMTIDHYTPVCVDGLPAPLWFGTGTAAVSPLTAVVDGTQTRAWLTLSFDVTVAGAAIVYEIDNATIRFLDGGTATTSGAGTGQFVPILTASNVCPHLAPMRAQFTGEIALAG
jgi:hypothetical protein